MRHWLIIDTHYLAWRAYNSIGQRHALSSVLLAVAEVERISKQLGATDCVFTFDRKPYIRKTILKQYKQTRDERTLTEEQDKAKFDMRSEIQRLHSRYLGMVGYENVFAQDGYEADDIIGAAVQSIPSGEISTIVSTDKDLYQLLSPSVTIYRPADDKQYTRENFRNEFGIHPSQWAEAKALVGCGTDDIPGVDGVGEVTACKYIRGEKINGIKAEAIRAFIKAGDYDRNLKLTTIPFPGLKGIELRPDVNLQPDGFRRLCERLDMNSVLAMSREHAGSWKRDAGFGD